MPLPIDTAFNALQYLKALSPIFTTEFGITKDVRPEHRLKASFEIISIELPIVTDVSPSIP